MAADDLVSIADELYASPIDTFTASRNGRAAEIKKAGNADLAQRVRALGKPTAAAAAANLLVRASSDALAELATLRERIAAASREGDRDTLRSASRDRQDLVARLVSDAATLLDAQGRVLSVPAADELGEALLAALGDADIAHALATGRLIAAPRTGGMSPSEIRAIVALPPDELSPDRDDDDADDEGDDDEAPGASRVTAVSPGGRTSTPSARTGRAPSSNARAARRRLERDLAAAESDEADARADRTRRTEARDALEAERDEKKDEVTRRRDALRLAERELDDAGDRLSASDADLRSRELEWKRAEASVRRARQALDAHEDDAEA